MALPGWLDFSANIRKHATFVAVLFALDTIISLLTYFAWNPETEDLSDELKPKFLVMKDILLGAAISNGIFLILFLIGFVKRQRWCLTICLGYVGVCLTLQFIALLGTLLEFDLFHMVVMLIVLAINSYILLVIHQLRKGNAFRVTQDDDFKV